MDSWRRDVGNASIMPVAWKTSAEAVNDKFRLLKLPVGWEIQKIDVLVHDASDAASTLDVGIETDDEDKFFTAVAINAQALHDSRADTFHKPYRVNKVGEVLMATLKGAAIGAATEVVFYVHFVDRGAP